MKDRGLTVKQIVSEMSLEELHVAQDRSNYWVESIRAEIDDREGAIEHFLLDDEDENTFDQVSEWWVEEEAIKDEEGEP